jgi:YD repeat-containing protein
VVTGYKYDPRTDHIDKLTHYVSDNNNFDLSDNPKKAEFDYTTRADGKKTQSIDTFWFDHDNNLATPDQPQSSTYDWFYDQVGRLASERIDHFDNSLDRTESFIMDLFGNRIERNLDLGNDGFIDERTKYNYDANDRLLTELAFDVANATETLKTTTTYGWTSTNQTSKSVFSHASNSQTSNQSFTYNLLGRLTSVTTTTPNSLKRVDYHYDHRNIRIRATDYVGDLQTSKSNKEHTGLLTQTNLLQYHKGILDDNIQRDGRLRG